MPSKKLRTALNLNSQSLSGTSNITAVGTITSGTWSASTIGVTKGGTGTSTQFTAGSVVLAGTSGVYTENNSKLFWDNTNYRLGIGLTNPDYRLHIAAPNTDGDITALQIQNNIQLSTTKVSMSFWADNEHAKLTVGRDGGNVNGNLNILLRRSGTLTSTMYLNGSNGYVGIGTASPSYTLDVSGSARFTSSVVGASGASFTKFEGGYTTSAFSRGVTTKLTPSGAVPNGAALFLVKLHNTNNSNYNAAYLVLTNTRSTNFGGGNSATVVSSAISTTGTDGEMDTVAFSIGSYGTNDNCLSVNVTTIGNTGTITSQVIPITAS